MLFGASFSDHVMWTFFAVWVLLLIAFKLFKTVDDDGTVTKAAEEGFAG